MSDFWWEVVYQIGYYLILLGACWLFGVATFANIFLTGRTHLLDKRGKGFFKHFPGLLIAAGSMMVLTSYVVAAVIGKLVIYWLR